MREDSPVILIGIVGGSGSGKTTLARFLAGTEEDGPAGRVLSQDSYYKSVPMNRATRHNFDAPASLEWALLREHLGALRRGQPIDVPQYDFARHRRLRQTVRFRGGPVVYVEGTLLYAVAAIRRCFNFRIYVHAAPDLRLARRVARDVEERGRRVGSVIRQYLESVRPMHLKFVEPSQRYADLVVSNDGPEGELRRIAGRLRRRLAAMFRGEGGSFADPLYRGVMTRGCLAERVESGGSGGGEPVV
jgi:uridine kinase